MIDLNDLRIFERVGALRSFAAASRVLNLPKSSVSRGVQRLEQAIGARLLQRTPRDVSLTHAGRMLMERCAPMLLGLQDATDSVGRFAEHPRGPLVIGVGIAFGVRILGPILPAFAARYPDIEVVVRLGGVLKDFGEDIDVAIRIGPLAPSSYVVRTLGSMPRYLCASPAYMVGRTPPIIPQDLANLDALEYPGRGDRLTRSWTFSRDAEIVTVDPVPRMQINDALMIHQVALAGGGAAAISSHLCGDDLVAGRLVRLLPDWDMPATQVHVGFPSRRELSPGVRAFIDFLDEVGGPGTLWQADPFSARQSV